MCGVLHQPQLCDQSAPDKCQLSVALISRTPETQVLIENFRPREYIYALTKYICIILELDK